MCGCACGRKNWGPSAGAAHYQNVCNVRADKNPRTLTVWKRPTESEENAIISRSLKNIDIKKTRIVKVNLN